MASLLIPGIAILFFMRKGTKGNGGLVSTMFGRGMNARGKNRMPRFMETSEMKMARIRKMRKAFGLEEQKKLRERNNWSTCRRILDCICKTWDQTLSDFSVVVKANDCLCTYWPLHFTYWSAAGLHRIWVLVHPPWCGDPRARWKSVAAHAVPSPYYLLSKAMLGALWWQAGNVSLHTV